MEHDTNGTDTRAVVVIGPTDVLAGAISPTALVVGPGTYEALNELEATSTTSAPWLNEYDAPDALERPPRKRGRYWESDLTRRFGRKGRK